ncbi:hypothetical protein [Halovivax gelatinilyticus]|uniref:hypothetical protein n=1 Tax=Halovivax gelatinilyticus TaxID=2961597 RepID=UPI0020CA5D06|nr:hypothetical protein [Halovivax gelatinilyticus]
MDEPETEPTDKPTESSREARQEGAWMRRSWVGIGSVSILTMLGAALIAMLWTGLIDVPNVIPGDAAEIWVSIAIVAVVVLIVVGWGWRAVVASEK